MKCIVLQALLLILFSAELRAQNQLNFLPVPSGLSGLSISGSGFIGTDSSGQTGLIGKNGKWLNKRRFSEIIGPVAGTYFAVASMGSSGKLSSGIIVGLNAWISSCPPEFSEPVFFVYRMDTLGKIQDSFRLSGREVSIQKAGLTCKLGFPESQLCLLPSRGNPVVLTEDWMPYKEFGMPGIAGRKSVSWRFFTQHDSIIASTYSDVLDSRANTRSFYYDEPDLSGIRSSIPGFSYYSISTDNPDLIVVYEKRKNPRYWVGNKIALQPSEGRKKPELWIQHKDGILCFMENEPVKRFDQVFRVWENDPTYSKMNTFLYTGGPGNYRLISAPALKPGIFPEQTSFLFSYFQQGINWGNDSSEAMRPENQKGDGLELLQEVASQFRNDFSKNGSLDPKRNIRANIIRPLMVLEKKGALVAIQNGHEFVLPPVQDTVTFLSRLRFMADPRHENKVFPVWDDFFESVRVLRPVMDAAKEAASNPELLKLPSRCIPAEFRSEGPFSPLHLLNGALYSEKGKRLPISGLVEAVLGTWENRLLIKILNNENYELRDASNQLLYSGNCGAYLQYGSGFLVGETEDQRSFLIFPKGKVLKKGKTCSSISVLFEENAYRLNSEIWKGSNARMVLPLFENSSQPMYFLDSAGTDEAGEEVYAQLMDGEGRTVMPGPLTKSYQGAFILLKNKTSSRQFPAPCFAPLDSMVASGKKMAWIFQDKSGVYIRLNGKNQRIPAEKVFVPAGAQKLFYGNDSGWFSITSNGKTTAIDRMPVPQMNRLDPDKSLIPMKTDPVCLAPELNRVPGGLSAPILFDPVTEKKTQLQAHPSLNFAFRLPDSYCPDQQKKWLVYPKFLTSILGDVLKNNSPFPYIQNPCLAADDEALQVLSRFRSPDQKEWNRLLYGITWLDDYLRPENDTLFPLLQLPHSAYNVVKNILMRGRSGLAVHFRNNKGELEAKKVSADQYYFSGNEAGCYAVKKESGLFEMFDNYGSLGQFKRIASPVKIGNQLQIVLAEKADGQVVGFYSENWRMFMFRPADYLQKVFPYLSSFHPTGIRTFLAKDTLINILPEESGKKNPFGYYQPEYDFSEKSHPVLKSAGLNGSIFNPFGLSDEAMRKSLQSEESALYLRLLEIKADGSQMHRRISLPAGYRVRPSNLGFVATGNADDFALFFQLDSMPQRSRKVKSWLFDAVSGKIFPLEGCSNPDLISLDDVKGLVNPLESYFYLNGKLTQLASVSPDIYGFRQDNDQLVAAMNPWTGFINKKGQQKISISCEGGSCSGEIVQFQSGFAALRKGDRLQYIDTTGKNPFSLTFACASDFTGDFAVVVDPQKIQNEAEQVQEESNEGVPADTMPLAEYYSMEMYWLHRSGKLIRFSPGKDESFELSLQTLKHNGVFSLIPKNEKIIVVDTSGKAKAILNDYILYEPEEYDPTQDKLLISENLFRVRKKENGEIGFCNTRGEMVIPCRFQRASSFINGIAAVSERDENGGGRYFYIDKNGKEIFAHLKFSLVFPFSEGLATALTKESGSVLLDSMGNIVAENLMNPEIRYQNGMASVSNPLEPDGKGYLNRRGQMVIPQEFSSGSDFSEGIAFVTDKSGKKFFIDHSGKRVAGMPEVAQAGRFSEGLCHVFLPEILLAIDRKTGKLQATKPAIVPKGYDLMTDKGYYLQEKSAAFSVWIKSDGQGKTDIKVLRR